MNGSLPRDIERERGFTHRGARREDDQVRLLKACQHGIELFKARAHAAQLILVL
jgi:hypothetical protein